MSPNDIDKLYCISELESSIGYKFNSISLLDGALRHSSFVNEHPKVTESNERLEFLGDAVLNLIISDLLIRRFPELSEGDMSRIRANLVNETQLSILAGSIELGTYLRLGRGEAQANGRMKTSILADALEAVIAAVYLDGGIDSSFLLIKRLFRDLITENNNTLVILDYKSKLQEKVQAFYNEVPDYCVVEESGPDHEKKFKVKMTIGSIVTYGEGNNKKTAEQLAAKRGLVFLREQK